jgi:class 3 adenylate cyclase
LSVCRGLKKSRREDELKPFERAFRERLGNGIELAASEFRALKEAADLDHPSYTDLELGQAVLGEAAILFLDIRGYTRLAMAFSDRPSETAKIIDAVVGSAVQALPEYGAHINDYTGDGVMAIFGDVDGSLDEAHDSAIFAASDLMTDMSATLRSELLDVDIEDPVQVAIGLVSGRVLWKRVGTAEKNRVLAIGEIAPLASKYVSGEETKAWQTMIGGEIIDAVPADQRERVGDYVREYKGVKMSRERWLLDTSTISQGSQSVEDVTAMRLAALAAAVPPLPKAAPMPKRHGDGTRHGRTTG